jgi:hypothetical protein
MRIDPGIVASHMQAAAAEQLSARLRDEGFQVESPALLQGLPADLIARRGDELRVYEFAVPGHSRSPGRPEEFRALHTVVSGLGGRLLLMIVPLPRYTRVEVEGLKRALAGASANHPTLRGLAARVTVRDVGDFELRSVRVDRGATGVSGEAAVTIELRDAGDEEEYEELLVDIDFDLALDRDDGLARLDRLDVDLPSWLTPLLAAQ